MKWSWKVGTFNGIAVYIHATFLLLIAWAVLAHAGGGAASALLGVAYILLVFLCVVLHEFGHALAGQRYGIQTRDITLYPIGGVARLERIPRNPRQELVIALAGPAVNVVIAASLFLGSRIAGVSTGLDTARLAGDNLIGSLMWTNIFLVLFNLLPAFPMDGGRVLRAFLAERMEYGRATQTAATVGQGMAFLFGLLGLLGFGPMLFLIAFFVYMGAQQEAAAVQTELAFRGVPARQAMMIRFATLAPEDPISRAADQLLAGAQDDFPVVQDGAVVGILTRSALIDTLAAQGPAATVAAAMVPAPAAATPEESLEEVFQRMRESESPTVPVLEGGRLVGLITLENVGELLMVRTAWERATHGKNAVAAEAPEASGGRAEETAGRSWLPGPRRRAGL